MQMASTSKPAPKAQPKPQPKADFQKLKGRWLRPDGGYVVEIKSVQDNGVLDASYANPQPIKISKANASLDGDKITVHIEFDDVNYRGSFYDLIYNPQTDQLQGTYYQAVMGQRFDIAFVRMP